MLRIVTVMSPQESSMSHVKSINVCCLSVRQPLLPYTCLQLKVARPINGGWQQKYGLGKTSTGPCRIGFDLGEQKVSISLSNTAFPKLHVSYQQTHLRLVLSFSNHSNLHSFCIQPFRLHKSTPCLVVDEAVAVAGGAAGVVDAARTMGASRKNLCKKTEPRQHSIRWTF
jgi:hypothetical protein